MSYRTLPAHRGARTIAVAASALLLTALVAACAPAPAAAPPPPPAPAPQCVATMQSTGSPAPVGTSAASGAPLSASAAAATASAAYSANAATPHDSVPIVTVEKTTTGPRIETHDVASPGQAAAVATNAARGSDLVSVEVDGTVHVAAATNDPLRINQWAMTSTGFGNVWPTYSGTGVKVAIVDTGVSGTHPDLVGHVLSGCSFLTSSPNGQAGAADDNGHGTHVAGIAGATTNNGVGIEGAAPGIDILPVKVLNATGSGSYSDVANGIVFAANNGARVINLSLGGTVPSVTLTTAINYARSRGAVVVAAAGNAYATGNPPEYPGAIPGVIAVAAIDSRLQHASFSNTGPYVGIAAPGVNIISTVPSGYAWMSGTSMATPFVSAAAAIVLNAHPGCTPDGVQARLTAGATDLGTPGRDDVFGAGLVDPVGAVNVAGC